jgi:Ca2+-binding RTX toxin-like protein
MANVFGDDASNRITLYDTTAGADMIYGFGGHDSIYAGRGNDIIKGGGGADHIDGGDGTDLTSYADSTTGVTVNLTTGRGNGGTAEGDTFYSVENVLGSQHADVITGDGGANVLMGGGGHDSLKGGGGADTLSGDDGDDVLKGGGGADTLNGGAGMDEANYTASAAGVYVSLQFNNAFYGDAEGDRFNSIEKVVGSSHADSLYGDGGNNVLRGQGGDDRLGGHGGHDSLFGGDGVDTLLGGDGDDVLYGDAGDDTLEGGTGIDKLYGGQGNDKLYGNEGVDTLRGDDGDDLLDGGSGDDAMIGGLGNDRYYVDAAGDVVTEAAGQGNDVVFSSALGHTLSANVETLSLDTATDTGVYGTGNAQANVIYGNANHNVLEGGGGADFLNGLGGNDNFVFRPGQANGDTVYEFQGNGTGVGDFMYFIGYGTAAQGANFVQLSANTWQINSANGLTHDVVTFSGTTSIDASDFVFI